MKRKTKSIIVVYCLVIASLSLILTTNIIIDNVRADSGWWHDTNWNFCKKITFNADAYISSGLSNFPMLVHIENDSDLYSHCQSDGDDILFTMNGNNETKLNHEIEYWNWDTGNSQVDAEIWVNVTTVSSSVDTIIWMYYGYGSASNGQNVTGVWDSNFSSVWHLNDTTSPLTDSIGNNKLYEYLSPNGLLDTTAVIDGGVGFEGDNDFLRTSTNTDIPGGDESFTTSFWVYPNSNPSGAYGKGLVCWGTGSSDKYNFIYYNGNENTFEAGFWGNDAQTGGNYPEYSWYYVVNVYNGSNHRMYVDGSLTTLNRAVSGLNVSGSCVYVGCDSVGQSKYFNGTIDEIRISNIDRNTSWITTEYNTAKLVSGFLTIGSEQAQWWNSSWNNYREIIINSTYIDSTLTNFPLLVALDNSSGNYCFHNSGADIRFIGTDNVTVYDFEIEKFDNSGTTYVWVKIPSISSSSDTKFLIYYDNSGASDGQNVNGTWSSMFSGVWHLNSGSDSNQLDSSGNSHTLTENGTTVMQDGKIGYGLYFDGLTEYLTHANNTDFNFGAGDFTLAAWVKVDSDAWGLDRALFRKGLSGAGTKHYYLIASDSKYSVAIFDIDDDSTLQDISGADNNSDGRWHFLVGIRENDALGAGHDELRLWRNTSEYLSNDMGNYGDIDCYSEELNIGVYSSQTSCYFKGMMDEIWIIKGTGLSDAWVNASFHSGNQTTGFLTFEQQQSAFDTDVSPLSWAMGNINIGTSARENFTFWQNGTKNIDITITVNDTNYTFVNWSQWQLFGHDRFCGNFTTDSWSSETIIEPGYPSTSILKSNFPTSNFTFGIKIWTPKTTTGYPSKQEDFSIILTVQEHT